MVENIEAKGKIDLDDVEYHILAWQLLYNFLSSPSQDEAIIFMKMFYDHISYWGEQRIKWRASAMVETLHSGIDTTSFSCS